MSRWMEQAARPRRSPDLAIWLAAGMIAVSVHAGAAALVLADPGDTAGEASPAPAVMIELAPEPVAERTDLNQLTEDRADAAESLPSPPRPEPPPEPLRPVEPPPEPQTEPLKTATISAPVAPPAPLEPGPQDERDPLEDAMLSALADVAVPLPVARPAPPRPAERKAEKAAEPQKSITHRKPPPKPASKPALKATAMVRQGERTAARAQTAGLSASPSTISSWTARLAAHLERRKRFPASAGAAQGTVSVVFRIDEAGRVLSSSLARSSGSAALDQAALDMVRRASPVPPPPQGASRTITAPVRFLRK